MERVYWNGSMSFPIEEALEPLFQDALSHGYRPYRDGDFFGSFGIANNHTREVYFTHCGHGRLKWQDPLLEVLLIEADECFRLGSYFGLNECACIVAKGFDAAAKVCRCWLEGNTVESVLTTTDFMNRRDLTILERED